jgi:hypothetical protein
MSTPEREPCHAGRSKKPGRNAAGQVHWNRKPNGSVPSSESAAELVVKTDRDEIDVLTDAIRPKCHARGGREVEGPILHEQVIVFDASRPAGRESIFQAGADRTTPTAIVAGAGQLSAGCGRVGPIPIVCHSRTALDVEQNVVGGPADLTGEQAEGVDLRVVDEAREERADMVACLAGRPSCPALRVRTPSCPSASDTNLTTGNAAGCIV